MISGYEYDYDYISTPLSPLNLPNKQASNKQQAISNKQQQALLLSGLAIAPHHRSGLYSTLAVLQPRWCPCQIPVLSQKLTGWAPGQGRQVGRCPPKSAHFLPQKSLLWPKTAFFGSKRPRKAVKTAKRRQTVPTLHVRLDCPVNKSPFLPSSSRICPRNGQNWRQKAPKSAQRAPTPRNQARAPSWATWLKNEFRGHLVHPEPPTFYGFQASNSPNETPGPPYQWSLGGAGGQPGPRMVGANGGSTATYHSAISSNNGWRPGGRPGPAFVCDTAPAPPPPPPQVLKDSGAVSATNKCP